jgi:hypothetical protein
LRATKRRTARHDRLRAQSDAYLATGTPPLIQPQNLSICTPRSAVAAFKKALPVQPLCKQAIDVSATRQPLHPAHLAGWLGSAVPATNKRNETPNHPPRPATQQQHARFITCKSLPGPSPEAQNPARGAAPPPLGAAYVSTLLTSPRPCPSYKTRRRPAAGEHTRAGHPLSPPF